MLLWASVMPIGELLDLRACDREPIHMPGSIQPHGVLLVVDQTNDLILQATANSARLIAFSGSVIGQTLEQVLGVSLTALLQRAEIVLLREPTFLGTVGPFGGGEEFTITAHRVDGGTIAELEPAARPETATRIFAKIRSITEHMDAASDLLETCAIAVREVRQITGYDRVLIYQFLLDSSGAVISEEKEEHLQSFLNHRFPEADIPKQARDLYRRNVIRVIPDVSYIPSPLLPALSPVTNQPLDMSNCVLRSVSPIHIRYLMNMGVGASMSISLLVHDKLWGLIACHNTTKRPVTYEAREACRHVGQILSHQIRASEETDRYRLAHEFGRTRAKITNALIDIDDLGDALLRLRAVLQEIVPSDGIAICCKETVATAGNAPAESFVRQLATWLRDRAIGVEPFATDCLSIEFPEAEAFASEASGLLAIILPGDDALMLMWFRVEQVEEINWAGNPHKPVEQVASRNALNPRQSFATWKETVRGRSRPWRAAEIETVREFAPRVAFVIQQKRVRQLNIRLAGLASTDSLTGLANRRSFDEHLQREWARAGRTHKPLALIILDLDFFKQYNDQYGHVAGDECLKLVAKALQEGRRVTDLAARIGGEEFSLLLPDAEIEGAMSVAETVRDRIERLQLPHAKSPMGVVTASFGAAAATAGRTRTTEDLVRAADRALYEAKRHGRNRLVQGPTLDEDNGKKVAVAAV
jgi:chemotaxis family two-component system sensor kinase Cph1